MSNQNRSLSSLLLRLTLLLGLLSEGGTVLALTDAVVVEPETPGQASDQRPFRVTDFMMAGHYRHPSVDAFALPHWYNGLSLSAYWDPKYLNFQSAPREWELNSFGIALTKDFNDHDAWRLGFNYRPGRMEGTIDYQWNLTNFYLGYDASRRWEWLATVGLSAGALDWNDEGYHRFFYGGQVGVQLRHHLSPYVSLYVEPQYKASSPLYDLRYETGNYVDDGLALQVGLITRLTSPYRHDVYGKGAHGALTALGHGSAAAASSLGHGIVSAGSWLGRSFVRMGHCIGHEQWYAQLLGGVQVSSPELTVSDLRLYPATFEMNLGRRLNRFLALQMGLYQERVRFAQQTTTEESFGVQMEGVMDLLGIFGPKAEQRGWAWTVSGGLDVGRLETWDHFDTRYWGKTSWTFASQLRRRLSGSLWLVGQARMQRKPVEGDHRQFFALLGVHYQASSHHSPSVRPVAAGDHGLWIAAADGWWNAHYNVWDLALGYDFTPIHGVRLDYAHGHTRVPVEFSHNTHLHEMGFDYVLNLTNAVCGYVPERRFSAKLFAGPMLTVHRRVDDSALTHARTYLGLEGGGITEVRLSRRFSLFAEQRFSVMAYDSYFYSNRVRYWNSLGLVGLKLHL